MPELDKVAVGIEQVHGGAQASRPGLLPWALHVAHVVERVAEGDPGGPHPGEGGVELLG